MAGDRSAPCLEKDKERDGKYQKNRSVNPTEKEMIHKRRKQRGKLW